MTSIKGRIKKAISPIRQIVYKNTGRKPWSYGYIDAKWNDINAAIINNEVLNLFTKQQTPKGFGVGYDERIVEYPWIFSHLQNKTYQTILDAGSTFNFASIVNHTTVKEKDLTIYTYYPESENFIHNRISYVFGDLRLLPFKADLYEQIVCQSTIEHVDMDNSIYGYELKTSTTAAQKSYEYLKVVEELVRVLKPGGQLLLTFPYGKFENHGFFQQFDREMVSKIEDNMGEAGNVSKEFIIYSKDGWRFDKQENCDLSESYNPHTGKGKGDDGAAHCRCVCCIKFIKN